MNEAASNKSTIKEMFLLAALYLPLGFFLWFFMASLVAFPAARLSDLTLGLLFPRVFDGIEQIGYMLEVGTRIPSSVEPGALVGTQINPMLYAWGMPLIFGLVMATPLSVKRRLLQCLTGFALIVLVQVWGVVWEALRDLFFILSQAEPNVRQVVGRLALSPTAVALCYQLGYLILPAVTPVAVWILMNRRFLEEHVIRGRLR